MAAYLEAALEDGDPNLVVAALGDIARSKGMTNIARETGLGRESLYQSLSIDGNPEFVTVLKVVQSLGLQLRVTPNLSAIASPVGWVDARKPNINQLITECDAEGTA